MPTLDQRYKVTGSWTARHIMQDEIAMYGGDSEITQHQEAKVKRAEIADEIRDRYLGQQIRLSHDSLAFLVDMRIEQERTPHASDCNIWINEPCRCSIAS